MKSSSSRERIIVAMSGGVDSSLAAAWLVDQGFEVIGVTLHLWDYPDDGSVRGRCCAPEDQHDARRVADHLGIAHFSFDRRALFAEQVVDPFVDGYLSGETPSPCVTCNRTVKMRELFEIADRLGARRVATGHYARIENDGTRYALHRGGDRSKDQSYFLYTLSQDQLARLHFPLGDQLKVDVRADAVRRGLPGAHKGESQELCFIPAGRYDAFVEQRGGGRTRPGPVVDGEGRVVGTHTGIHRFTMGQRKGLGVALGAPAFVVGIEPDGGTVRLGGEELLQNTGVRLASDAQLIADREPPFDAMIQVRSRHEGVRGSVHREGSTYRLQFASPVRAVAKGQVAVVYDGTKVLGGGTIVEALR